MAGGVKKKAARKTALDALKMCLSSDARPEFASLTVKELIRNKEKIADYPDLFRFVIEYGSDETQVMFHRRENSKPEEHEK